MMTCNDCPFCGLFADEIDLLRMLDLAPMHMMRRRMIDTQRKSDDKSPLKMLFLLFWVVTLTPNMIWIIFLMAFTRVDWVLWETNPFYILDKYIS